MSHFQDYTGIQVIIIQSIIQSIIIPIIITITIIIIITIIIPKVMQILIIKVTLLHVSIIPIYIFKPMDFYNPHYDLLN